MGMGNIETKVEYRVLPDNDADTSYLEQSEFADRLAAYQRDEFSFVGVRAVVTQHNWTSGVVKVVESPGLWGIESDSGEDYLWEVGAEELTYIAGEVATAGIDISGIEPELRDQS